MIVSQDSLSGARIDAVGVETTGIKRKHQAKVVVGVVVRETKELIEPAADDGDAIVRGRKLRADTRCLVQTLIHKRRRNVVPPESQLRDVIVAPLQEHDMNAVSNGARPRLI